MEKRLSRKSGHLLFLLTGVLWEGASIQEPTWTLRCYPQKRRKDFTGFPIYAAFPIMSTSWRRSCFHSHALVSICGLSHLPGDLPPKGRVHSSKKIPGRPLSWNYSKDSQFQRCIWVIFSVGKPPFEGQNFWVLSNCSKNWSSTKNSIYG